MEEQKILCSNCGTPLIFGKIYWTMNTDIFCKKACLFEALRIFKKINCVKYVLNHSLAHLQIAQTSMLEHEYREAKCKICFPDGEHLKDNRRTVVEVG